MTSKRERYTPTDIGPTPSEWSDPFLGKVAPFISNGFVGTATPHYAEPTDKGAVTYLYGMNVRPNRIDRRGLRYVNEIFHASQSKTELKSGDLLMVQSGHIGTVALVPDDLDGANCHALIISRLDKTKADPLFLSQYLNSEIGVARLRGLEVGSTIMHINTKDLKKFRVPIPPLPEQRKIAAILSTWDQAIEKTEALLSNARTQKRALMQQLLTGKRRFPAFEGQPWTEVELGDVCKLQTGPFGSQLKANEYSSTKEGVAVIMPKALIGGVVVFTDCDFISKDRAVDLKKHRVAAGDVLFSRRGDVARTALVTEGHQPALCGTGCLKARPTSVSLGRFLAIILQTEACRNWLVDNAVGQTMLNLNTKIIAALPIQLPCEAEQSKIVSVLEASDAQIVVHEKLVGQLRTEKKALMQQLLTGKRRVVA